jgi:competence protein ComEC
VLATRSSAWLEWDDMVRWCAQSDIAVSDRWLPRGCSPKWLKLDRDSLGRTGGVAIYLGENPQVATVAEELGQHPWATPPASAMRPKR